MGLALLLRFIGLGLMICSTIALIGISVLILLGVLSESLNGASLRLLYRSYLAGTLLYIVGRIMKRWMREA